MRVSAHVTTCLGLTCLAGFSPTLTAQPVVLHEQVRIAVPEPYFSVSKVCLYGDDVLGLAHRLQPDPHHKQEGVWALVHFRKQADGEWRFVSEVAAVFYDSGADIWSIEDLACEGPLAAFSTPTGASYAVELTSVGWEATRLEGLDGGSNAAVYRDTVAIAGEWRSPTTVALVRKNAAGQWADVTYAVGNPGTRFLAPELAGPNRAWVAATEIAATGDEYEPPGQPDNTISDLQVFDLISGSWRVTTLPFSRFPGAVINDRLALQRDVWTEPGDVASYFVRDAAGAWTVQHSLLSDENISSREAVFRGERAFASIDRNGGEIGVFRSEAPGRYRHEATLSPSDLQADPFRPLNFSVEGDWVATASRKGIYLFNVPATLPTRQRFEKTFEDNSKADWSFSGNPDWRIVSSSGSRVFRQLRTDGPARAVLETSGSADQAIEADVTIRAFSGTSPWAGFLLRYTDLQNYYYLLVDKNSVQIRKIVNGAFEPIATAPLALVLNRTYRFRIEAVGSRLRAFVNGALVGEVIDDAHARGKAGLTMFRARTDYDNVIVTSSPQTQLFADSFSGTFGERQTPWTSAPTNAWSITSINNGAERVYRQSLISGTPRAVNGGPTGDQIVTAIVRPRAFNPKANGWIGLTARHVDDANHYYVALYRDKAALRKRVNGVHRTIEEIPFTVSLNTVYRLRLEAIGASLRFYVNGRLVAEGQEDALPTGRYGLITFNAAADFDNFSAIRP